MYSEEIRNSVLVDFIKGKSINDISKEKNISLPTLYSWLKLSGYHKDTRTSFHKIMKLLQEKDYKIVIEKCNYPSLKETVFAMLIKKEALAALKHEKKNSFIWVDLTEISDLFKKKKYQELLDKYQLKIYDNNYHVQIYIINSLVSLKRFSDALDICERSYFEDNVTIQSKKITLCMQLAKVYPEKAEFYIRKGLEVCEKEYFYRRSEIQSQKITLYMLLAKMYPEKAEFYLQKGLDVCSQKEFLCNAIIQSQKITLYMLLAKMYPEKAEFHLQKGLDVCSQREFLCDKIIQKQKFILYSLLGRMENTPFIDDSIGKKQNSTINSSDLSKRIDNKAGLSNVFTKIYAGVATIDMIEDSNLSEFEITVLMLMYYEKNNKAKAISFIKEKIANNKFLEEQYKMMKSLLERLKSKKSIFDYGAYAQILHIGVDFDLYNELLVHSKNEILNEKPNENVSNDKYLEKSVMDKQFQEKSIKPQEKIDSPTVPPLKIKVKKKKDKKALGREKTEMLKEKFPTEYNEILRHLYIKVHSEADQIRALMAFDRFLLLGERAYDDIYRTDPKTSEIIKCGEVFDHVISACYTTNDSKRVRKNWK